MARARPWLRPRSAFGNPAAPQRGTRLGAAASATMRRLLPAPAILLMGALACLPGTFTCGTPAPATPAQDLPVYEGMQTRLFDDSLSLRLANPALASDGERLLDARAIEAEAIFVARLETVTQRSRGRSSIFELVFAPERALVGSLPGEPVVLEVGPESPSHGMIRSQRLRLLGVRGVVFLKRFQEDNEVRIHARVEPDEPAIHDAIVAARM